MVAKNVILLARIVPNALMGIILTVQKPVYHAGHTQVLVQAVIHLNALVAKKVTLIGLVIVERIRFIDYKNKNDFTDMLKRV